MPQTALQSFAPGGKHCRLAPRRTRIAGLAAAVAGLALSGCATPATPGDAVRPAGEIPVPGTPAAARTPSLPPIPEVDGELALEVGYPSEDAALGVRTSTFVFGSTGSGRAQLTINDTVVEVAPNGGFLAFLPVPEDGVYRLRATLDGVDATLERTVRIPPSPPVLVGAPEILPGSTFPVGGLAAPPGERIEVGFRGTPGGQASLLLPGGDRIPLVELGAGSGASPEGDAFLTQPTPSAETGAGAVYAGILPARQIASADSAIARPAVGRLPETDPPAEPHLEGHVARFELVVGPDTVSAPLRLNLATLDPARPIVAVASRPPGALPDWRSRGRNDVAGPFHYFWPPGTRMEVVGERNGMLRIRLAGERSAWVPAAELTLLPEGAPPPAAVVASVRLHPGPDHVDVRVPMGDRLPFQVVAEERHLQLDIFGATSRTNFFQYGMLDPLVERAAWSQPADGIYRVSIRTSEPIWGYDTFFDETGALVLRIRRPPRIDPQDPFRGLRIVVDPGHGGADRFTRGPTGLTEADANLWISLALADLLRDRGAEVVMTRTEDATVPLGERPILAVEREGHLLVSVHNNAFPDGVDPWENQGTSVYYFHPHSAELARLLQHELLEELGLPDIGIGRADLAMVRPTWMPSVLSEIMFMMIPEQEAALRDPEVQTRIARAHLRAIEAFLVLRSPP